ncbi:MULTISPECIES: PRC-barrel domain-containing protein [Arthrobacter]|uniref:PRC-barrel domain containing protein n=1 Tax=Arthrobacter terricola TaxID=2547396 RepID=A0A4V2ZTN9_9MICC|nr:MULTISPECIES: PRC-barrel domain-containing protein [Arthrobacter]MBT8160701.1 PRC-barrel domain-containing protein [Arthrobacter sp. GN70]TDF97854.1 PRC-barrel domain containing protein [Arthrobacter terricola]
MLSLQDIDGIVLNGGIVVDANGEKIGSVEQIFTSGDSGDPVFVTVRTGFFGMSESFVPLADAVLDESTIRVAFGKETVKNGPRIDSDRGVITSDQEQELYRYFGIAADDSTQADSYAKGGSAGAEPPTGPPPPPPPHLLRHIPGPPPPGHGPPPPAPGHRPPEPPPGRRPPEPPPETERRRR